MPASQLAEYFPVKWEVGEVMSIRSSIPDFFWWLFWILVAILLVLFAALLIHHFGGASLTLHVGYFHFEVGVR